MADKFCISCGARNSEQTKFCTGCGAPIPAAPPAQQATEPAQPLPPIGQPFAPAGQPFAAAPQPMPGQPFAPAGQPAYPPQPYQAYPMPAPAPAPAPKKKRTGLKVFLGIVIGLAALVAVILIAGAASMRKAEKLEYYEIENDRVPSINAVLGEARKVTGVGTSASGGMQSKYWEYESVTPQQDVDTYCNYLVEKEGCIWLADPDTRVYTGVGRNSAGTGHLEVLPEIVAGGYTIRVVFVPGKIEMLGGEENDPTQPYVPEEPPTTAARGQEFSVPPIPTGSQDNTKFSDTADYYFLGPDKVPTVKAAIGHRRSTSSDSLNAGGIIAVRAEYESGAPGEDVYYYVMYLQDQDGFLCLEDVETFLTPEGVTYWGRNATASGYQIIVTVTWYDGGFGVDVERSEGEIIPNG